MPFEVIGRDAGLVVIRIRGRLSYAEWEAGQRAAQPLVAAEQVQGLLVLTEAFEGWERGEAWGSLEYVQLSDAHLSRIAIVGDPAWREDMLGFSLAGMRKAAVEFFTDEAQARAWLAGHLPD